FKGRGRVECAQLSEGPSLDISAVVIGVGITPATELAGTAGLALDNGNVVDDGLQASIAGIFAAGDVASFRDEFGRRTRRESWDNAQRQGIAAGKAMLGQRSAMDPYPWFWSDQYDQNIQMVGSISDTAESIELPATSANARVLLYRSNGRFEGAVGINAGRDIRMIRRRLEAGQTIDVAEATNRQS